MNKDYDDAYVVIEDMVQNHYSRGIECTPTQEDPQKGGLYKDRTLNHINAKVDALLSNFHKLSVSVIASAIPSYEICKVNGDIGADCQMILTGVTGQDSVN